MRQMLWLAALLLINHVLPAQHHELQEQPAIWKQHQFKQAERDSNSLRSAFKRGTLHGHIRNFLMVTDNQAGLSDYHANATGGAIRYETGSFRKLKFVVSGFFVYNTFSSDIAKPDMKTGALNRYEVALFDVEDHANKHDIDRLEELHVAYQSKQLQLIFGKQLINTPFINLQDGRMRPTGVEGLVAHWQSSAKTNLDLSWLYRISPRGTVQWYGIGESIGVYPPGVNMDGTRSGYPDHTHSNFLAMLGWNQQLTNTWQMQLWNLYADKVFNTAMLQLDYQSRVPKPRWIAAMQLIQQQSVADGGNIDQQKAYFPKDAASLSFGGKFGWENKQWSFSMNYNRITAKGRYLMPREWGRDPFFTFLARERNDGLGDVHALVGRIRYDHASSLTSVQLGVGYYQLPDVTDTRLNKYGLPSYVQSNLDIRHKFKGFFEGLEAQLLYLVKWKAVAGPLSEKFIINKVNMQQWNFVVNYHF